MGALPDPGPLQGGTAIPSWAWVCSSTRQEGGGHALFRALQPPLPEERRAVKAIPSSAINWSLGI